MKRLAVAVVFTFIFLAGCFSSGRVGGVTLGPGQHEQAFETVVTQTVNIKYLLFLPAGYGEQERQWPLILFLHGAGERGDDLEKVKVHGPPKIVENRKDFPFIVVSPQCPAGYWWPAEALRKALINLLDEVIARYAVDADRIYLTGLSMGGYGTWALACEQPQRFAALAPICGAGEPEKACNIKDVPVWVFHGAQDKVVPLEKSQEMVDALKACRGDVKFTVYPEAGHDSWTATYDNPELYDWFLSHKRTNR